MYRHLRKDVESGEEDFFFIYTVNNETKTSLLGTIEWGRVRKAYGTGVHSSYEFVEVIVGLEVSNV